jgi:hypothetical protein
LAISFTHPSGEVILHSKKLTCYESERSGMWSSINVVIAQHMSMLRVFWQTIHGNELTCYGLSEGSGMQSPVNVVNAQHINLAEGFW